MMNWKYILSLSPDDLTDQEKDELYNTVTWFNCGDEDLNLKKCLALIKVSQEILKYKGEQVETLLHELDELATKQGEEDVRKLESDTDIISSKSRKSSSIEFENLEQKYIELKNKYKKQVKLNEKTSTEFEKVKFKIRNLEKENNQLHQELHSKTQEGSESDVSETVRDQHRELIEVVQNKNKQISDLLHDIEDVEKENFVLRDKLGKVRDDLATATEEITLMTEKITATEAKLSESLEQFQALTGENEVLREQLQSIQEEKQFMEQKMEEFTKEINLRIDDWKKTIHQKDLEIDELRKRNLESSIHSSLSSLPNDEVEKMHVNALNKVLADREKQILELQIQLKDATSEMIEITNIIENLKSERATHLEKIEQFTSANKDLKKQLKSAHERSQNLQDDVEYAEQLANSKDADLKELIRSLKDNGQQDLSEKLNEIYKLKSERRHQEKHIGSLVKASNKLQANNDRLRKENEVLRNRLNLTEDEEVNIIGTTHRKNKYTKEIQDLKKQLAKYEEENLDLKSKIQKLNRNISSLSDKLIDLGHKPDLKTTLSLPVSKNTEEYTLTKKETSAIIQENEALRKGMHEILNSINSKKESTVKEIKSDTLEKLLRALDVKHISGWYHPAMRLQAELHNLEGINAELREQLRIIRIENEKFKNETKESTHASDISEGEVITEKELKSDGLQIQNAAEDYENINIFTFEKTSVSLEDNVEVIVEKIVNVLKSLSTEALTSNNHQNAASIIINMLNLLNEKYRNDKFKLENEILLEKEKNNAVQEQSEIYEEQVKVLTENQTTESIVKKLEEFTKTNILNKRKVKFLEQEINKINKEKEQIQENLNKEIERNVIDLKEKELKNEICQNKIEILENQLNISVESDLFNETKNSLLDLTLKYRDLLNNFEKSCEEKTVEVEILKETNKLLEASKLELKTKLVESWTKLYSLEHVNQGVDENVEKLSKKLAECDIKTISERQRADHINNLYELVKEQLHKSEEKLKEFSKYNETILQKNLFLQEQLKESETKLCEYVDNNTYKQLQVEHNASLEEINELKVKMMENEKEHKVNKETVYGNTKWTAKKEQELLSLKHQIVDLVAVSDEKMLIAQLHSDNKYYRMLDIEYTTKMKNMSEELNSYKKKFEKYEKQYQNDKQKYTEMELNTKKKLSLVENILIQQKMQYLGCIPVISEEKMIKKIRNMGKDKHEAFLALIKAQKLEHESEITKDKCNYELQNLLEQQKILKGDKEEYNKMLMWLQEKKTLQLNELRYKRQAEFKEVQLQHLVERVKIQDEEIAHLEEELLLSHKHLVFSLNHEDVPLKVETIPKPSSPVIKMTKSEEIQTIEVPVDVNISDESKIANLKAELIQVRNESSDKDNMIDQLKSKVTEQEMTISMFRKQIGDKQSQITFYERHILELQSKDFQSKDMYDGAGGDNISVGRNDLLKDSEEILSLKALIAKMNEAVCAKEKSILEYESLLKDDRDKHSLGAARLQEEIKVLQKNVIEEKQKNNELEECIKQSRPNRAAIDEYVNQVHSLEKHTAELHTSVSSLEAQLQTSRQEAVRWRTLANDRLQAMNDLHKNLEEQHKNELSVYKEDSEKWREEVNNLKDLIAKHRNDAGNIGGSIQKIIKEKENKIHELTVMLRLAKNEAHKAEKFPEADLTPKLMDLESSKELLQKENEMLKKRYEQLMHRERGSRDEIRELKVQLLKKPITSARSDKSEKSIKDLLQKKIASLEAEIVELKDNLDAQIAIHETHKIKSSEDFDRWKKQKYWQQTTEKLKNKLKEKDKELEKLLQTSSGYRLLIERFEREKHNLENRIRHLKAGSTCKPNDDTIEMLRIENMKLLAENQSLISKLEMSQHHAGGLGAAMLQEKLEAQERKIAILELSAKGTVEVRAEMERMQSQISSIQKKNLCLEAENLEYKMDLEKSRKDVPHLHEQIQHLESYVDVLKNENSKQLGIGELDKPADKCTEVKKVSELERTVFILKRVVEKLQVENKRLLSGKRPYSDRTGSADKLKRDYHRLKEQYGETIQKVAHLEQELTVCRDKLNSSASKPVSHNVKTLLDELSEVRKQLEQKSMLLDKVKVLLQRAAIKEKALLEEIAVLKRRRNNE